MVLSFERFLIRNQLGYKYRDQLRDQYSIEILSSSSTRKTQTERKHEVLPGHRSDCPLHPGDGILRTLLQVYKLPSAEITLTNKSNLSIIIQRETNCSLFQPLQTLQKCLQQPGVRLEVLHPGGRRHSRRTDRGGHQRPGTSHHIRPH